MKWIRVSQSAKLLINYTLWLLPLEKLSYYNSTVQLTYLLGLNPERVSNKYIDSSVETVNLNTVFVFCNWSFREDIMISWKTFIFGIFLLKINIVDGVVATEIPKEIFVAFSTRVPFVYRTQTGELKGLDVMIIENFATKLKLNVKYVEYNISFNEMFRKEETFENFLLNRKLL